jgi:hypothetical protein
MVVVMAMIMMAMMVMAMIMMPMVMTGPMPRWWCYLDHLWESYYMRIFSCARGGYAK